jgi:osmotically-inducible protein OsmY
MTIGFEVSPRPANVISARFEKRLTSIPRLKILTPVKVTMEKETAVLRGTVARERDRDLIARLALLEPGISNVRNQLIVAPEGSTSGRPN